MEPEASLDISQGVHPRIVKEDFGVHLRTIFRWIKKGHLPSVNGRVQSDYKNTSLVDWKRSCSFLEGEEKLNISSGTRMAWKKKGLLKTVRVMGQERVLISSVVNIIQRRNRGTFSLHPTHSLPHLILEITGISYLTLKDALDKGTVPSVVINGIRMIPNEEVERIKKDWKSSCRPIAAQRILSKNKSTIYRRVISGRLPSVVILGERRIILRSIAKTPEEEQRLKDYLRLEKRRYKRRLNAGVKGYRKLKKAKNAKKREKIRQERSRESFRAKRIHPLDMAPRPPKRVVIAPIPDYKPEQVKVGGFESRRLTTCEEAAKATGKTASQIKDLFMIGTLRGENVDEQVFIYLLSLENLIAKLKKGVIS